MRVSVIIPTHNRRGMLREAIASARAQTLPPTQIIVCDDGSTDGTEEDFREPDALLTYLRQAQAGPAAARNMGLRAAQGDAVAFLDSDDVWTPRKLEVQCGLLESDPEIGAVFCLQQAFRDVTGGDGDKKRREFGATSAAISAGGFLGRMEIVRRLGEMRKELQTGEFAEWFGRGNAWGLQHAVVEQVLLLRRVHAGNISRGEAGSTPDYTAAVRAALARKRAGG